MNNDQPTRSWLGYDWFKTTVAVILAALLLYGGLSGPGQTPVAIVSTAVPVASATIAPAPTVAPAVVPIAAPTTAPSATAAPSPTAASSPASGSIAAPTLDPLAGNLIAGPATLSGTSSPNSLVEVLIDGVAVGTATVSANGTWSLPEIVLAAGERTIVARTVDAAGAELVAAEPVTATVGAANASTVPTIDAPAGLLAAGPLTLTGTGTPGSSVEILVDDEPLGTTTVSADGSWAFDVVLAEGDRSIVARTLDGSARPPTSEALALKVGAPAAGDQLAILAPREGAKLPAGPITINGTGTPGTDLEVLDSDKVLGEGTVTADGTWEIEVTPDEGEPAIGVRIKGSDDVVGKPIRITVGKAETNFCTGLELGCQAWVTRAGGFSLRMRAGAGTDQAIVAKLPIGTQMELLEGPSRANNLNWYRVRTKGDQEGWVAGENLVLQPD